MQAIVIGNIAIDETFRLPRLPVAGETMLAAETTSDLGGKGANQAVVLARSGVLTRLVARVGRDEAGARLRALLAREALDAAGLIETEAPTDRSVILLGAGENVIVSAVSDGAVFTHGTLRAAMADCVAGDLLVMQGNLPLEATRTALEIGRARGLRAVFNPAPAHTGAAAFWPLAELAVLNEVEARQLAAIDDPAGAARAIRAAGAGHVAVTLGAEGAMLCGPSGMTRAAAVSAEVRDTTGAGDTFTAVLAAALLARRLPEPAALHAAMRAAAITISRPGTLSAFPNAAELATILRS